MLIDSGFGIYTNICQNVRKVEILRNVLPFITPRYIDHWTADMIRQNARTGTGGNKLRFCRKFKTYFNVESYCKTAFNRDTRGGGGLGKFRSGTAPIAIETGHYNGVNINFRKCFSCRDVVEDETHVLLHCPEYNTLRDELLNEAEKY